MPRPQGIRPPRPVRVVIADDDRIFAHMIRARLGLRPDLEVVGIASDGDEAVALVEEFEPDLVLMDVNMPVMDGIEATRLICALPDAPTVVMVTGEDEDADARAYEAGAAAYLRKSVELVSLIDVVLAVAQLAGAEA
jgi:DNA-binding NarL/FixJ family response regulator